MEMPNHFGGIEMAFEFGFNRIELYSNFELLIDSCIIVYLLSERASDGVIVCVIFKWIMQHVQGFCVAHTHTRFVHSIHYAAQHTYI